MFFLNRLSVLVARPIEIVNGPIISRSSSDPPLGEKLPCPYVKVKSVSCGDFHSAVLTSDNKILLWGDGELRGPTVNAAANGLTNEHSCVDDSSRDQNNSVIRNITNIVPANTHIKQVSVAFIVFSIP